MSKFLKNPSLLTKDQLKSELKTHGITLPRGDQRKQVYVDLYLKRLTSQNTNQSNGTLGFSSDEDEEFKPLPKKPPHRPKPQFRKPIKGLPFDVNSLSDGDLARQLRIYGQVVGPITETTRPLYQKKLIKLLQEEVKNQKSVQPQNETPKAWEYSDNEEEYRPSNRTFEVEKESEVGEEQLEDKHVVTIPDEDDNVDSSPEPLPVPELTHYTKQRPCPPRESNPKVVKRETIVSESHMETRKRVFTPAKQPEKTFQTQTSSAVKSTKMSEVNSGSSWEWKAVLVVLAIITTILLVYYFMEEPSYKPKITNGEKS